jgi:uncharacterized phage protein (TIGR01671 family)
MTIIFRGKRLDTGYWAYGDLIKSSIGQFFIKYGDEKGNSITEIDPKTIGQFTNLCDKNGLALYTGDIINFGGSISWEITFENGAFCIFNEPLGWEFDNYDENEKPRISDMQYCVRVGNIHDNPELINENTKEK